MSTNVIPSAKLDRYADSLNVLPDLLTPEDVSTFLDCYYHAIHSDKADWFTITNAYEYEGFYFFETEPVPPEEFDLFSLLSDKSGADLTSLTVREFAPANISRGIPNSLPPENDIDENETGFFVDESNETAPEVEDFRLISQDGSMVIDFEEEPKTLGRSRKADYNIGSESGISRLHAEIRLMGLTPCIKDLDSSNGTYVNNSRIRGDYVELSSGDSVIFFNKKFVVEAI